MKIEEKKTTLVVRQQNLLCDILLGLGAKTKLAGFYVLAEFYMLAGFYKLAGFLHVGWVFTCWLGFPQSGWVLQPPLFVKKCCGGLSTNIGDEVTKITQQQTRSGNKAEVASVGANFQ